MEKLIDTILNLIEKNKYEEALTECSRLVFLYPLNPLGYELRGDCFLYFRKYELAFINYREAISLTDEKSDKNKINLSQLYKKKGICDLKTNNIANAVEDFTNSIKYNPDNYDAYHLRSKAYRKLGNYELALKDANNAIELFGKFAEAYNNRGSIYYLLGKPDEAINDFTKAISLRPDYSGAYYNRSLVYSNLKKDYKLAKEDLEKAEFYKSNKPKPPTLDKTEEAELDREKEKKLKTYEEKREEFKNMTIENGMKLSEGLFDATQFETANILNFDDKGQETDKPEEKSFSDIFTTNEKKKIPTPASKGELENIIVEDVLEAKHKTETLSTPFVEEPEEQQKKSIDDLVSEVKIPDEVKTLHEEIVLPPEMKQEIKVPQQDFKTKELDFGEITDKKPEAEKETKILENIIKEERTEQKEKKDYQKSFKEERIVPSPAKKPLITEPRKSNTVLYIIISLLILAIIGVVVLMRLLKESDDKTEEKTLSQKEAKNLIIYEREDTNKITLGEDLKNIMIEKGLVLVVNDEGFEFQAGSFKDSLYAVSRMEWLSEQDFEPRIEPVDLNERGKFFRVRFGEFNSIEEADSTAKIIK